MHDKADIAISSKKFEGFSLKERESDKPLKRRCSPEICNIDGEYLPTLAINFI